MECSEEFFCLVTKSYSVDRRYEEPFIPHEQLLNLRSFLKEEGFGNVKFSLGRDCVEWKANLNTAGDTAHTHIELALWLYLNQQKQISLDQFRSGVKFTESSSPGRCSVQIALALLINCTQNALRTPQTPSRSTASFCSPTGFSPDSKLEKIIRLRTPARTTDGDKEVQTKLHNPVLILVDVYRELHHLSSTHPNLLSVFSSWLQRIEGFQKATIRFLCQTENVASWEVFFTIFPNGNPESTIFWFDAFLKKKPALCGDLLAALLHQLKDYEFSSYAQLVIPLLDRQPALWGKLAVAFDAVTQKEGNGDLTHLHKTCVKTSLIDLMSPAKNKDGSALTETYPSDTQDLHVEEPLSRSINKLTSYFIDVIPVLEQCFLWGQKNRQWFGNTIQISTRILGDDFQITPVSPPVQTQPNAKYALCITPPPRAKESIVVLLLQKLHSLLGDEDFRKLIQFESSSVSTFTVTFDAMYLQQFDKKVASLAGLSFEEIREKHIDVLLQRTFYNKLETSVAELEKANPARLEPEQSQALANNLKKLARLYISYNEALVTDDQFRAELQKKWGNKSDPDSVKRDPDKRLEALFIYVELPHQRAAMELVINTFKSLESKEDSDVHSAEDIPAVKVQRWLDDMQSECRDDELMQCYSTLNNVWNNFYYYYGKNKKEGPVQITIQTSAQPEKREGYSTPNEAQRQPKRASVLSPMAEVQIDSPTLQVLYRNKAITMTPGKSQHRGLKGEDDFSGVRRKLDF